MSGGGNEVAGGLPVRSPHPLHQDDRHDQSRQTRHPAPESSAAAERRLTRAFYARKAEVVARQLLGCVLGHRDDDGVVRRARIVETEAYVGPHDLACHASRGRTRRTEVMYGEGGYAYVYLIYGLHHMFNVVTGSEGHPEAVLVRACAPLENCDGHLSGPGSVCRALGIDLRGYGEDLLGERLWLEPRLGPAPKVVTGPRIGVDYAGEWASRPLRYAIDQAPEVSRPRPFVLKRHGGRGERRP